jgi:hypothetical protein
MNFDETKKFLLAYKTVTHSQSSDERVKALKDTKIFNGVCFGLTTVWAGRHKSHKGETPGIRMNAVTGEAGFAEAKKIQLAYFGDAKGNEKAHEASFWKSKGFNLGSFTTEYISANDDESVAEALTNMFITAGKTHQYTALGFKCGNGGHQMVSYHSGGKVFGIGSHLYFYDPNNGEFKIPHSKLKEFFKLYWIDLRSLGGLATISSIEYAPLTPT